MKIKPTLRIILIVCIVLASLLLILFTMNGLWLANNERHLQGLTAHSAKTPDDTLTIIAYNIAKGFLHNGGLDFESAETVRKLMDDIATAVREKDPDLLFLSEAVFECTPCPLNQVVYLAEQTGMHCWIFGENYNFGLPFFRIVGGNAILSKFPLKAVGNPSLPGRQPFYITKNNRRALWAELQIGNQSVLLASLHNDSYNRKNNLLQTEAIVKYIGERDAVLAGDFNANPADASMILLRESGRFSGELDGPPTFSVKRPRQVD